MVGTEAVKNSARTREDASSALCATQRQLDLDQCLRSRQQLLSKSIHLPRIYLEASAARRSDSPIGVLEVVGPSSPDCATTSSVPSTYKSRRSGEEARHGLLKGNKSHGHDWISSHYVTQDLRSLYE